MQDFFDMGAEWLGAQGNILAGRTLSIKQGTQVVSVAGYLVQRDYQVLTAEQLLTTVIACDWTFNKADLTAAGIELRGGAVLTETHRGQTRKYEAMDVGDKPAVEEIDTAGILVILHTKRIV